MNELFKSQTKTRAGIANCTCTLEGVAGLIFVCLGKRIMQICAAPIHQCSITIYNTSVQHLTSPGDLNDTKET